MSSRIKSTGPVVKTRAQAEEAVAEVCRLVITRNTLEGDLNREIAEVRERYERDLDEAKKAITSHTANLEAWASAHPDEFPTGRKSIDFLNARVGFRTGTPKLALKTGQKWGNVLGLLNSLFGGRFIRQKIDIAKDELLAAFAKEEIKSDDLDRLRVKVVQEECFFIEPAFEQSENRATAAAS